MPLRVNGAVFSSFARFHERWNEQMCEFVFLWSSRLFSKSFLPKKIHCVVCYFEDWRQPKHNRLCFGLYFFFVGLDHWRLRDKYMHKFSLISKKHIKRKTEEQKKKRKTTQMCETYGHIWPLTMNSQRSTSSKANSNKFHGLTLFFWTTRKKTHSPCPNYCCPMMMMVMMILWNVEPFYVPEIRNVRKRRQNQRSKCGRIRMESKIEMWTKNNTITELNTYSE